jgi:hypothetical protein
MRTYTATYTAAVHEVRDGKVVPTSAAETVAMGPRVGRPDTAKAYMQAGRHQEARRSPTWRARADHCRSPHCPQRKASRPASR